jgi:hypothetical protein
MKNLSSKTILVLIISLVSINQIMAQTEVVNKKNSKFWLSLNWGSANHSLTHFDSRGNTKQFKYTGTTKGVSFSYNNGPHIVTLKTSLTNTKTKISGGYNIAEAFFTGLLGGTYNPGPKEYSKSKIIEGALMYGLITKPATWRFHASSGISYVSGNENFNKSNFTGAGIPLEIGLMLCAKEVAFGLSYIQNFNKMYAIKGLNVSLIIGGLR